MIRELKHLADLGMSRPLADLMSQNAPDWLATEHFDFVLPMPLSKERRLKRGFNQKRGVDGYFGKTLRLDAAAAPRGFQTARRAAKYTEKRRTSAKYQECI